MCQYDDMNGRRAPWSQRRDAVLFGCFCLLQFAQGQSLCRALHLNCTVSEGLLGSWGSLGQSGKSLMLLRLELQVCEQLHHG